MNIQINDVYIISAIIYTLSPIMARKYKKSNFKRKRKFKRRSRYGRKKNKNFKKKVTSIVKSLQNSQLEFKSVPPINMIHDYKSFGTSQPNNYGIGWSIKPIPIIIERAGAQTLMLDGNAQSVVVTGSTTHQRDGYQINMKRFVAQYAIKMWDYRPAGHWSDGAPNNPVAITFDHPLRYKQMQVKISIIAVEADSMLNAVTAGGYSNLNMALRPPYFMRSELPEDVTGDSDADIIRLCTKTCTITAREKLVWDESNLADRYVYDFPEKVIFCNMECKKSLWKKLEFPRSNTTLTGDLENSPVGYKFYSVIQYGGLVQKIMGDNSLKFQPIVHSSIRFFFTDE